MPCCWTVFPSPTTKNKVNGLDWVQVCLFFDGSMTANALLFSIWNVVTNMWFFFVAASWWLLYDYTMDFMALHSRTPILCVSNQNKNKPWTLKQCVKESGVSLHGCHAEGAQSSCLGLWVSASESLMHIEWANTLELEVWACRFILGNNEPHKLQRQCSKANQPANVINMIKCNKGRQDSPPKKNPNGLRVLPFLLIPQQSRKWHLLYHVRKF